MEVQWNIAVCVYKVSYRWWTGYSFIIFIFFVVIIVIVTRLTNYNSYYCNRQEVDRLQQLQ